MLGRPKCYRRWQAGRAIRGIPVKLDTEAEYEGVPVIMAKDSDQEYVVMAGAIIGIVVFLLGIVGIFINLYIT